MFALIVVKTNTLADFIGRKGYWCERLLSQPDSQKINTRHPNQTILKWEVENKDELDEVVADLGTLGIEVVTSIGIG